MNFPWAVRIRLSVGGFGPVPQTAPGSACTPAEKVPPRPDDPIEPHLPSVGPVYTVFSIGSASKGSLVLENY